MILTNCAACAAPLAHNAPRCVRCATRYGRAGEDFARTLKFTLNYAETLCLNPAATLDDLREAVNTLEDTARVARRVMGSAHPLTATIEDDLRRSRAALRAREMSPGSA